METIARNRTNAPRCHESNKFKPDMGEFLLFLENSYSCTPAIGYYTRTEGFVNINSESIDPPIYWAYTGVSFGVDKSL
jgi:hypothetical protein